MERTRAAKAESCGVRELASGAGRKSERQRRREVSSWNWLRSWGGDWKKPAVELEGVRVEVGGWEDCMWVGRRSRREVGCDGGNDLWSTVVAMLDVDVVNFTRELETLAARMVSCTFMKFTYTF